MRDDRGNLMSLMQKRAGILNEIYQITLQQQKHISMRLIDKLVISISEKQKKIDELKKINNLLEEMFSKKDEDYKSENKTVADLIESSKEIIKSICDVHRQNELCLKEIIEDSRNHIKKTNEKIKGLDVYNRMECSGVFFDRTDDR